VTRQRVSKLFAWSNDDNRPATAVIYLRVSTRRQARSGGEVEGYSIPAQREACRRKAEELGATVLEEYVDAGASARSADRPALQALLGRLHEKRDVGYVIIHKIDRLARNRVDDVEIGLSIHAADAVLVSATEQIDNTPQGLLMHGIMATVSEFYSSNLSFEAKKGLRQKAKLGGTPTYAPLGYLNGRSVIDGRQVKTIVVDPERAPHLRWAFDAYSTGQWSITELVAELDRRGLRTRPTATRQPVPLTRSQIHRILSNKYYTGVIVYEGVEYKGRHRPLVDKKTWQLVQQVLGGRRTAGDRSWRHDHYLKGSLYCAHCDSRLGVSYSRGKSGIVYPYFYCLGRNKKRTHCDLPYLGAELVEEKVIDYWRTMRLAAEVISHTRRSIQEEIADQKATSKTLLASQRQRLRRIEARREKLIDAYLAGALAVPDLKRRQDALAAEQADAERLIEITVINHDLVEERLEIALRLLEHCDRLYVGAAETDRRALNQAFFDGLFIGPGGVERAVLASPFSELADRTIGLHEAPKGVGEAPRGRRKAEQGIGRELNKANPEALQPRGSNVTLMAGCHELEFGVVADRGAWSGARPRRGRVGSESSVCVPVSCPAPWLIGERLRFSADAAVEVEPDEAETVRRDGHRLLAHEPVDTAGVRCAQRVATRGKLDPEAAVGAGHCLSPASLDDDTGERPVRA
jgi:site-specific DNA recombinase